LVINRNQKSRVRVFPLGSAGKQQRGEKCTHVWCVAKQYCVILLVTRLK